MHLVAIPSVVVPKDGSRWDSGVWGLKKNFALLELLERLQNGASNQSGTSEDTLGGSGERIIRCDEDENHIASMYCTVCATHLCRDCSQLTHSTRTLAKHRRVPLADKPHEKTLCLQHQVHAIEFVCPDYLAHATVVFVIDSSHRDRLMESHSELAKLLTEKELRDALLLIFANKQDVAGALSVEEITELLSLHKLCCGRSWHIQGCDARSGMGLHEGLDWLSRQLVAAGVLDVA
ncbi:UNVERIFIED_CONTAM: hypothetical protein FKN15_047683 [Acipenser sinensis]